MKRKSLERLGKIPVLTIALIVASVVYFFTIRNRPSDFWLQWILTPIMHKDEWHLAGNLITLAISGSLVELWIASSFSKRSSRVHLFLIAYGINAIISVRQWSALGELGIGLSLFHYAFIGFALYYYVRFPFVDGLRASRKLVRLAIGFLVGLALIDFCAGVIQHGFINAVELDLQHIYALAFALAVSPFYFKQNQEAEHRDKTYY